ncbi:5'-methylthioadenosine/S-adenosylhomocysteine nucleosidase [Sphingobium sp. H39-3-25]|nr:5'-methylthioadenosine/S-adenosylhomocysteine nucleosidase [Sphingobium arseniciresistens]
MMRVLCGAGLALLALVATPAMAQKVDTTPRTAVMTAFPPEWDSMVHMVEKPVEHHINGLLILTGTMAGKPVVLMQSGVSMVNAAMTSQLLLDRFTVKRIVFSGIAGGIDPGLDVGDVVVPERWNQYMEVSLARKLPDGSWAPPERQDADALPNYGMMFPRGVRVGNATEPSTRHRWFMADPALLTLARSSITGAKLARCLPATGAATPKCLEKEPKVIVGGGGVSGPAFADNAEYREYLFKTFQAQVLDMESAAVAHVAYANSVPYIAFRSLSDLAGGGDGPNQMVIFMNLAAVNSATVVRSFVAALPD